MTFISKRIRALRYLRDISTISFVAALGSLILMAILIGIGNSGKGVSEAAGITVYVFDTAFNIARIIAIILFAIVLVLTLEVNGECRSAFWVGVGSGILALMSGIFTYTLQAQVVPFLMMLLAYLGVAVALFLLIDGVFEKQARKTQLFSIACLGIGLLAVGSVLEFITFVAPLEDATAIALYFASEAAIFLAYFIIFIALQLGYKKISSDEEVIKAQESEEAINEIQ